MTSLHVVDSVEDSLVLYGILRKSDFDDQMRLPDKRDRVILPHIGRTYVDLRTDAQSHWVRFELHNALERSRLEYLSFKVEFTHLGFFYYSTQARGVIPLLQNMVYPVQPSKDGVYLGVYQFNEPLPFQMHTAAGEELLKVTMM